MWWPPPARSFRCWVRGRRNPYDGFDFTLNREKGRKSSGGYNGVVAGNAITRAGCCLHARRKFVEAEKTAPEMAREAVDLIGQLFAWKNRPRMCPWPKD